MRVAWNNLTSEHYAGILFSAASPSDIDAKSQRKKLSSLRLAVATCTLSTLRLMGCKTVTNKVAEMWGSGQGPGGQ